MGTIYKHFVVANYPLLLFLCKNMSEKSIDNLHNFHPGGLAAVALQTFFPLPTPLTTVGVCRLVATMKTPLVSISSTLLLHLSAVT